MVFVRGQSEGERAREEEEMGRRSGRKNERRGRRTVIWVNLRPRRAQPTSRLLRVVPRAEHLSPPPPRNHPARSQLRGRRGAAGAGAVTRYRSAYPTAVSSDPPSAGKKWLWGHFSPYVSSRMKLIRVSRARRVGDGCAKPQLRQDWREALGCGRWATGACWWGEAKGWTSSRRLRAPG